MNINKIFLIGMPGSGKTTKGKQWASLLQYDFIDMDAYIEQQEGCTIASIMLQKGENYFRTLERNALHQLLALPNQLVIACGGGTPCFFDNIDIMLANGWVVLLRASWSEISKNLYNDDNKRPLLIRYSHDRDALQTALQELWTVRSSFYLQAHHVLDASWEIDSKFVALFQQLEKK